MKKFCYFTVFQRYDQHLAIKQAKAIKDAGYDVTLVFTDGLPDEYIDGIKLTSIQTKTQIGSYVKRLILFPFHFIRKLNEVDADIYQTCDVDSLVVCLLLKLKKKKVLFNLLEEHPYTLYKKLHFPQAINGLIVGIVATWMKFCFKRIDAIVTVAPDIIDYLNLWGIRNVQIIGNYPLINKDYSLTESEYLQREDRIIYFGAIYGISCQKEMLDALDVSTTKVKYLLAGDFGVGEDYRRSLIKHPKWKDVEFVNRFPKSELPKLLAMSTISNVLRDFNATYYRKGSYGIIKLFESMEAALPIICPDVPVYRQLMKDYPCGILVDPKNSHEIEKAIEFLVSNKKEAYIMGQMGRKAVIEKFSWDRESIRYINIINKCVQKEPNRI